MLTVGLLVAAAPSPASADALVARGPAPVAAGSAVPAASRVAVASGGTFTAQDIAVRGEEGFPQYRIPGLTTSTRGTVIAAYDGRPDMGDVPGNIAMVIRRSTDNGATWLPQQVVRSAPAPNGFSDPSLVTDRETGRVFLFYAASVNRGYAGSTNGTSDTDPDVLHADYSYSDDDGLTWTHRRITSMIKTSSISGMFAASGQGIQLRQGPKAGRIIQQYTIRQNGGNYAVSVYSDDHGANWSMGTPVGAGADENKTVELSDGTVMLNVRAAPNRLTARSTDQGVTYSPFTADTQLPDPANNGSVIRYAPDAPASDPRSKWLLFSNTEDTGIRRNLTVKMSCDDGKTWPVRRVVDAGSSGYSTLTTLADGRIGMLYEHDGYQQMGFAAFDLDWLGGLCAPVTLGLPATVTPGTTAAVTLRAVNQSGTTTAPGTFTLDLPAGWSAPDVAMPALNPGQGATVTAQVAVPASAAGSHRITARYRTGGLQSWGAATVPLAAGSGSPAPGLSILPVLDTVDVGGGAGVLGDPFKYWTRVTNTGNTTLTSVRVTGNQSNLVACDRASLAPGQSYVCKGAYHTITQTDLDAGSYTASLTVTGTAPGGGDTTAAATGETYPLRGATGPVLPGGTYQLLSAASGKAVDVPASSTTPGTQLAVWTPHTGGNQRFTVIAETDGTYTLRNVTSGLCVDLYGGGTAAGTKIIQWTCTGGDNQRWLIDTAPSGGYTVTSKKSGLALATSGSTDGSLLTQQANTGADDRRWSFV
ncbi:RICIN domain-containing protein [Streptomyces sp. NPDC058486]|uniref:RICIN domain-containing protein n=1 Tax=Streptomyces sp. NPDC058486 TaxID=3346526 RepID=UPI003651530F